MLNVNNIEVNHRHHVQAITSQHNVDFNIIFQFNVYIYYFKSYSGRLRGDVNLRYKHPHLQSVRNVKERQDGQIM